MLQQVDELNGAALRTISLNAIGTGELLLRAQLTGRIAADLPPDPEAATVELRRRLRLYPAAADIRVLASTSRVSRDLEPQVEVGWFAEDGVPRDVRLAATGLHSSSNSGAYLWPPLNAAGDRLTFPRAVVGDAARAVESRPVSPGCVDTSACSRLFAMRAPARRRP